MHFCYQEAAVILLALPVIGWALRWLRSKLPGQQRCTHTKPELTVIPGGKNSYRN